VYVHGGGWVLGGLESYEEMGCELGVEAGDEHGGT
jgi:acetyl esterase/lipase